MSEILLKVQNLEKTYETNSKALRGISFDLYQGETLGIVGESGCGKTTLGRCLMRLTEITAGKIYYKGEEISKLKGGALKSLRRKMQIVFQDPYASLNPRMTIGEILNEPLEIHHLRTDRKEREVRILELLDLVGLRSESVHRFPHEFSGGQRQRVGIARALAVEPELLILDEPVSALDVSIQSQIINLLLDIQKKINLTYIFIAHDLRVIRFISDRVAVMNQGEIVELASTQDIFEKPQNSYTKTLLSSIPSLDPTQRNLCLSNSSRNN